MTAALDGHTVRRWLSDAAAELDGQRERLTALDAAIGDADHGTNMVRGFAAVRQALDGEPEAPPGALLGRAAKALTSTVGGASGPLWGMGLRRAGRALGDRDAVDGVQLLEALEACLEAIVELGSAQRGDKTMVDALGPAVDALRAAVDEGDELPAALARTAEAATRGAEATIPLVARRGRASYLGPRSAGHEDPGAASTAMVLGSLARAAAEDR